MLELSYCIACLRLRGGEIETSCRRLNSPRARPVTPCSGRHTILVGVSPSSDVAGLWAGLGPMVGREQGEQEGGGGSNSLLESLASLQQGIAGEHGCLPVTDLSACPVQSWLLHLSPLRWPLSSPIPLCLALGSLSPLFWSEGTRDTSVAPKLMGRPMSLKQGGLRGPGPQDGGLRAGRDYGEPALFNTEGKRRAPRPGERRPWPGPNSKSEAELG